MYALLRDDKKIIVYWIIIIRWYSFMIQNVWLYNSDLI